MTTTTSPSSLATPPARPKRIVATRIGWGWVAFSAITVVIVALAPYLTSSLRELADADASIAATYADQPLPILIAFYSHIGFGAVALLIGPLQFARGLRVRFPLLHRVLGSISIVAIVIAAIGGVVISPLTSAGLVGTLGFGVLGILWATFALLGLRALLRRDIQAHRAWMTRAFALTFAAVTLRLWIPILMIAFAATGSDPDQAFASAYVIVPFLCWVPNLIFAEWLVRRTTARVSR